MKGNKQNKTRSTTKNDVWAPETEGGRVAKGGDSGPEGLVDEGVWRLDWWGVIVRVPQLWEENLLLPSEVE